MLLSKASEYGIRAVVYLASVKQDDYLTIKEITDKLSLSFHFTTKIFQQLTSAGILISHKGPRGGISFARSQEEISLYEIVVAIDGDKMFEECVLGLEGCGEKEPCPLHEDWAVQRRGLEQMLKRTSLAQMAYQLSNDEYRISND